MLTFRSGRDDELVQLQSLVDELYEDDPGDITVTNIARTFAFLSQNPNNGTIVVFERAEKLIGYAILIYFWSNEFGGIVVEIDELLVSRGARGSGVATKFFQWLEENIRADAVACALQVSDSNDSAGRLYDKMGFKPTGNHYMVKTSDGKAENEV